MDHRRLFSESFRNPNYSNVDHEAAGRFSSRSSYVASSTANEQWDRSLIAVVVVGSLLMSTTLTISLAALVFCKKKNTVFVFHQSEHHDPEAIDELEDDDDFYLDETLSLASSVAGEMFVRRNVPSGTSGNSLCTRYSHPGGRRSWSQTASINRTPRTSRRPAGSHLTPTRLRAAYQNSPVARRMIRLHQSGLLQSTPTLLLAQNVAWESRPWLKRPKEAVTVGMPFKEPLQVTLTTARTACQHFRTVAKSTEASLHSHRMSSSSGHKTSKPQPTSALKTFHSDESISSLDSYHDEHHHDARRRSQKRTELFPVSETCLTNLKELTAAEEVPLQLIGSSTEIGIPSTSSVMVEEQKPLTGVENYNLQATFEDSV